MIDAKPVSGPAPASNPGAPDDALARFARQGSQPSPQIVELHRGRGELCPTSLKAIVHVSHLFLDPAGAAAGPFQRIATTSEFVIELTEKSRQLGLTALQRQDLRA